MGRIGDRAHGGAPWVSRDYAEDYQPKCRVSHCPCNDAMGRCTIPTQIDIRADGVCQKSIDFKGEKGVKK